MPGLLICGVDGSIGAREAARVACRLADALGAKLLLVHVGTVIVAPGASRVPGGRAELTALAREDAERVEAGAIGAELRVAIGSPVELLARTAAEEGATLLVVGSRGRGYLRAALMGSVSAGLCRSAPCPVVVVPAGAARA